MQSPEPKVDLAAQKRGIRNTVTVLLLVVATVIGLIVYKATRQPELDQEALRANNAVLFDTPRRFSDFELLDQQGELFTREQLQGQWSLVFFGFTHCPDICPMTLVDLANLLRQLPAEVAADTRVILVTLDPARDTPEVLAEYVPHFNPDFIGLTGEFLTIRRFANELNVAFAKVTLGEGDDDYTVDHSSHIALINPRGDYHAFFRPPFDVAQLELTYTSIRRSFRH